MAEDEAGRRNLAKHQNELRVIVRCHLIPAFGSRHIHLITTSLLEEYMWVKFKGVDYDGVSLPVSGRASQEAALGSDSFASGYQTLRQIFAFAQDNHLLSNEQPNPVSAVNFRQLRNGPANRQKDKVLEKSQVVDLLEAATDEWEELLYRLMAQMGLRIGEAVALKAEVTTTLRPRFLGFAEPSVVIRITPERRLKRVRGPTWSFLTTKRRPTQVSGRSKSPVNSTS